MYVREFISKIMRNEKVFLVNRNKKILGNNFMAENEAGLIRNYHNFGHFRPIAKK